MSKNKRSISILSFVIFLLITFASNLNPPTVKAVPAGEACCPDGYGFVHGACMSQNVVRFCGIVSMAIGAVNQQQAYYLDSCFRAYSAGVKVDNFCNFLVSPGRESYDIEIRACEAIRDQIAQDNVLEISCDSGLACRDNMCTSIDVPGIFNLCSQAKVDNNGVNPCTECVGKDGLWTAVGCLPTQPNELIPRLVQFFIGIAGGIALMLMLVGALRLSLSAGNPDALKVAKEMITNAIAGLVVIIFSAVLLQVIGVEIFKIPGF
jgi:hypothetical protein